MPEPDFRAALQQLADAVDEWEIEPAEGDPLRLAMDHARELLQAAKECEHLSSALADLLLQVKSCDGTAQINIEKAEQVLADWNQRSGCHDGHVASAAQGVLNDCYEFSVVDSEDCEQAGGSAPTLDDAIREGRNYLSQYNQDGPHKLELRRVLVLDYSEAAHDHA